MWHSQTSSFRSIKATQKWPWVGWSFGPWVPMSCFPWSLQFLPFEIANLESWVSSQILAYFAPPPPLPVAMVSSPQRTKAQKNASHVVLWLLIYLCVKYLLPSTFVFSNYQKQPHNPKPSIIYPPGALRSPSTPIPFSALLSWCWASQTPSQPPRMELKIRSERPARKTKTCFWKHWEQWKKGVVVV